MLRGPTILVIEEAEIEYSDGSGEDRAPWEEEDFDEDGDFEVEVAEAEEDTGPVKMRRRSMGSKPEALKVVLPPLTLAAAKPVFRVKDNRSRTYVGKPFMLEDSADLGGESSKDD